jgi:hypothetical protein
LESTRFEFNASKNFHFWPEYCIFGTLSYLETGELMKFFEALNSKRVLSKVLELYVNEICNPTANLNEKSWLNPQRILLLAVAYIISTELF